MAHRITTIESNDKHYGCKLSEEMLVKMKKAQNLQIEHDDKGHPLAIIIDNALFSLHCSKEAQAVDAVKMNGNGDFLIMGSIQQKFSIHSSQVDSQVIRERTEKAEQLRTSRKTLSIENPVSTMKRTKVTNLTVKSDNASALVTRLVHLLALEDCTRETVLKRLNCPIEDIDRALIDVSIPNGILFKLKPSHYHLVNVDKWPSYSARDRQMVKRRIGHVCLTNTHPAEPTTSTAIDMNKLADQRIKQMMRSKRRK